uniref:Reverse transcriptase domain-containing protein n=1 Tax=Sander lucioperca TaxID=283035 RepID=A0A8C9YJL5_SANLU
MLKTLKQFGFGENFIEWVNIIYLKPVSSILTNSDRSQSFELKRGVRQGDPLSPLLFDITLEPLAIGIRSHPGINGVKFGNVESLVNLYADDLLICLSDPVVSVPNLLNYIKSFSKLSGYTINWDKCEFMPLTNMCPTFLKSLPFKIVNTHITYLGLKISRNPKLLLKLNFLDMMDTLKANIRNWKLLPLSMIGRINAVKMVALPRFLYLFQNLPIYLPLSFFKQLDLAVLSFVWADKPPRISKAHLQKDLKSGGLGLPVFRHYYWATGSTGLLWLCYILSYSLCLSFITSLTSCNNVRCCIPIRFFLFFVKV